MKMKVTVVFDDEIAVERAVDFVAKILKNRIEYIKHNRDHVIEYDNGMLRADLYPSAKVNKGDLWFMVTQSPNNED
jgi:hypothetical protein